MTALPHTCSSVGFGRGLRTTLYGGARGSHCPEMKSMLSRTLDSSVTFLIDRSTSVTGKWAGHFKSRVSAS